MKSSQELKRQGLKLRNSLSRVPRGATLLNWGKPPQSTDGRPDLWEINPYVITGHLINKLRYARAPYLNKPEFTEDIEVAREWAGVRGEKVVCRETLTGHSGEGIVIARNPRQVVEAPLYSKYFKKVREFRVQMAVSVMDDLSATITHLASKRNGGSVDDDRDALLIRSGTNGWVYQTEDREDHLLLETECFRFIHSLVEAHDWCYYGLILALDVAQAEDGTCCVLEANTAPGLNEGTAQAVAEGCDYIQQRFNTYEDD